MSQEVELKIVQNTNESIARAPRNVLRPHISKFEGLALVAPSAIEVANEPILKKPYEEVVIRDQAGAIRQFGPLDGKHEYIPNKEGVFDGSYGTIEVAKKVEAAKEVKLVKEVEPLNTTTNVNQDTVTQLPDTPQPKMSVRTLEEANQMFGKPKNSDREYAPNAEGEYLPGRVTLTQAAIIAQLAEVARIKKDAEIAAFRSVGLEYPSSLISNTVQTVEPVLNTADLSTDALETNTNDNDAAISDALAKLLETRAASAIASANDGVTKLSDQQAPQDALVKAVTPTSETIQHTVSVESADVAPPIELNSTIETTSDVIANEPAQPPIVEEVMPDKTANIIPIKKIISQDIIPPVTEVSESTQVTTPPVTISSNVSESVTEPVLQTPPQVAPLAPSNEVPKTVSGTQNRVLGMLNKIIGETPRTPATPPVIPQPMVQPEIVTAPLTSEVVQPPVSMETEKQLNLLRAQNMILAVNEHLRQDLAEIFGDFSKEPFNTMTTLPPLNPEAYLALQSETVESLLSNIERTSYVEEHKKFKLLIEHYIKDSEMVALPQETVHDYLLRLSKKVDEMTGVQAQVAA